MRVQLAAVVAVVLALVPARAQAGFTQTLPAGAFLLDESISFSFLSSAWGNDGTLGPLIAPVERYEPGGGMQGILTPDVDVRFCVLINQLQYGILDNLTFGVGVPVVLSTDIDVNFGWQPGDYQPTLGRPYGESDFWDWAASMGQPRPGNWRGNRGVLSDVVLGVRYRFSDHLPWFKRAGVGLAVMFMGNIPTARQADPEEVVSAGTTMWDLHSQGELGVHLAMDKSFLDSLDGRLILGLDLFYEALLPQEFSTPRGVNHPLLLNYQPYVGDTYRLDPGDFAGASFLVETVPLRGPVLSAWMAGGDSRKAESLPPILTVGLQYKHTRLAQSDWTSDSAMWDWEREKLWRPGYKNTLFAKATLSLFRLGVPVQLYAVYRNQTLLPGKNCRAANVFMGGVQLPAKLW
jgi:hypothetical protein